MTDVALTRSDPRTWRLTALEPVWVPYTDEERAEREGKKQRGRESHGPNGESPDSGKWRLQWPKRHPDFGGQVYRGETLSVSALDTASECLNKWGKSRIHGFEEPEKRKAALGNLRHDELEGWLKYGTNPQTSGMAAALVYFPAPGAESEVFFGFAIERPEKQPIVIAGWVDCRESAITETYDVKEGNEVVTFEADRLNSIIYDLKTTGDFRWKKTPAQLRANIQAAAYALGEMLRVEAVRGEGANGTEMCLLRWVYAQLKELTDKKKTSLEDAVCEITRVEMLDDGTVFGDALGGVWISREEALAVVSQYVPLAETLLDILERAKTEHVELPKNMYACESYGGCAWKKLEVEMSWEETVTERKLVFEGARERLVTIERKEKKTRRQQVCTPPEGGQGFMAMHKQAMAKKSAAMGTESPIGGHAGVERVLGQWTESQNNAQSAQENNMGMGLAERFKPAVTQQVQEAAKTVEAPKQVEVQTQAPSGGLAGRFSAKTGQTATEVKTGDVKATSDGMASSGSASSSGGGPTLANRLQALRKGEAAGAVESAVANAPTNSVATGQRATGVNPPDAAPEWTQEQQIAEGERLAAAGKAATSGEVIEGVKAPAQEAPKKPGRPAGSKNKPKDVALDDVAKAASDGDVVPTLDLLAQALMNAGRRREASILLKASADIEALSATPTIAAA